MPRQHGPGASNLTPPGRVLCGSFLGVHGLAAAMWFLFMPGGFPVSHARFWVNGALPVAAMALVAAGLVALCRMWDALPLGLVIASLVMWLMVALIGRIVFPVSLRWLSLVVGIGAAAGAWSGYRAWRGLNLSGRWLAGTCVPATAVAALLVLSQRSEPPDTRPLNPPMPEFRGASTPGPASEARLGDGLIVAPSAERFECAAGGLQLAVRPLLTFRSRSPDRCWTVLASRRPRVMPARPFLATERAGDASRFLYGGVFRSIMEIGRDEGGRAVRIDARTELPEPVFSHLNSLCEFGVAGMDRLFVSFSPCPGERIEVLPSDYPTGRPARLAYLRADGTFNIVEATSGEKGPFETVASGRLGRDEALAVTLHDADGPACRLTFEDWAAQAGTSLSPTAGWGLPVNAIEFVLVRTLAGARASVFITLAGTSVGRGWDSVGHSAGTYRNRILIEELR